MPTSFLRQRRWLARRLSGYSASIVLSLAALAACGREPAKPAPPPLEVTTLTIEARDVPVSAEYVAQTQSSQAVNIPVSYTHLDVYKRQGSSSPSSGFRFSAIRASFLVSQPFWMPLW